MDEILVANFRVFQSLLEEEHYDLVIADEAWDLDYFLHENPEHKRCSFAWMTDFVGWLPMERGGEREARITADYNAEMIEHVDRFKRVRDRSIFVGDPDDIVPATFGPDLPTIRDWTVQHFDFSGYITGFQPPSDAEREESAPNLGYRPDETVCIVTVGGSGVGASLLKKIIVAQPFVKNLVPGLRMVVVAGPRIDPGRLDSPADVEVRTYVPDLCQHLSACDVAVVQGGLTTTMELTAARRPFIYFPLANHFEQQYHVRHRLDRYGAGIAMDYATSTAHDIAESIAKALAARSTTCVSKATGQHVRPRSSPTLYRCPEVGGRQTSFERAVRSGSPSFLARRGHHIGRRPVRSRISSVWCPASFGLVAHGVQGQRRVAAGGGSSETPPGVMATMASPQSRADERLEQPLNQPQRRAPPAGLEPAPPAPEAIRIVQAVLSVCHRAPEPAFESSPSMAVHAGSAHLIAKSDCQESLCSSPVVATSAIWIAMRPGKEDGRGAPAPMAGARPSISNFQRMAAHPI